VRFPGSLARESLSAREEFEMKMKPIGPIVLAIALFAGLCCAQETREPSPRPAPKSQRVGGIAFLDMYRIFKEAKAVNEGLEQARAQRVEKRKALRERAKQIEALSEEQEKYASGSEDFFRLRGEIEELNATLELDRKIIDVEYDLAVVRLIRSSYARVRKAAAEVAQSRGFDAVAIYSEGELSGRSYREALGDIMTRNFIWLDGDREISDAVVEILNR